MSNPYNQQPNSPHGQPLQYGAQPFGSLPVYTPPARPRMFANITQRVIWTLVPVLSVSLLSFLPFVVAAVKGVVKPWVAAAYVAVEVVVLIVATVASGATWVGLLEIVLLITAATHTNLLDEEVAKIGRK